ncbi:hypothetical protein LLH03_12365 [bacterium]|nr:hypothetical protein [bacterium]
MSEKSAEMRHLEHEDFVRQLTEMRKEVGENDETIRDFIVRQADAFAEMRLELLNEVRGIERSIASKCEQDSAIIGNVNRHEAALIRVQGEGSETAKALAVVTENMKALKTDTDKSLKAAHDAIRGHGIRIDKLEKHGGKLALKILYSIAGVGGTAAITLWVKKLLGG